VAVWGTTKTRPTGKPVGRVLHPDQRTPYVAGLTVIGMSIDVVAKS
jgi:hypothetical protein